MAPHASEDAPVEVVPYSSDWPAQFGLEADLLRRTLGNWLVADLEHIGSTSVHGLCAKPVIDIMAPVKDLASSTAAIKAAEEIGYCYFPYKADQMHWFCKPGPAFRTHHLHLIPWQGQLWKERLVFRDTLRMRPALAQEYGNLKRSLAERHPHDREAYTEAKAPFVAEVLRAHYAAVAGAG